MNKSPRDRFLFGGNREIAIQRDGEKCVKCGMTRAEHREKYGRDITVDHIDGNGRNAKVKNNDLGNLQTLCLSCHGKKDIRRRVTPWRGIRTRKKLTEAEVIAIRRSHKSHSELSKEYPVSSAQIGKVRSGLSWADLLPLTKETPHEQS